MQMKLIIKFFLLVSFTLNASLVFSQDVAVDTIYKPAIFYTSPKSYQIAGIKVEGVSDRYDPSTIIELSGLYIGQVLDIPGEKISASLKKLDGHGIFTKISFELEKTIGNKAYIIIKMSEMPKLSKINYSGAKKSEISKLKEKFDPHSGTQVTANMVGNLKRIIEQYYKDKGYYNMEVSVMQRDDPENKNFVILDVNVRKKDKIKISEIVINGNKEVSDNKLKRAMKKTKEKSLRTFLMLKSAKYINSNYEEDKYNLLDKYNELGYRDAAILSDTVIQISPNRVKIIMNVEEGNRYYFNNVKWVGNTVYSSELLNRLLNVKKGDVYNKKHFQERLTGDEDAVQNALYLNEGYLFSRIIPIEKIVGKDSIDLELRVIEGRQARINRVNITGNDRTHEHVVRRELYVYPGDLFSRNDYMRSLRQVAALGNFDAESLYASASEGIIPNQEDGTVDIGFKLTEKGNDKIEISGGWGAGMFIGSLALSFNNFSMRNIFNPEAYKPLPEGDGQKLSLRAQTNGKYYSSYSISFTEPWLGGSKPNNFSISAYYSKMTDYTSTYRNSLYNYNPYYRNTYTNPEDMYDANKVMKVIGFTVGLGRRLRWPDDYFIMQNEFSLQRYDLKNWPYGFAFETGKSNNMSFNTTIRRASIDRPIYTRSGSDFTLSVAATLPYSLFSNADMKTESPQDKYRWIEYHKWKFNGKVFIPLERKEKLVLYGNVQFGYLGYYNKYRRSPFEGFQMGGSGMSGYGMYGTDYVGLRGYEDGSITNKGSYGKVGLINPDGSYQRQSSSQANIYQRITLELRYPIVLQEQTTVYALAFLEGGNSWLNLKDFDPFKMYRSAGFGVRIFLPMFGLLGFDWGYGFDTLPGVVGNQKRSNFHFVLGQEF